MKPFFSVLILITTVLFSFAQNNLSIEHKELYSDLSRTDGKEAVNDEIMPGLGVSYPYFRKRIVHGEHGYYLVREYRVNKKKSVAFLERYDENMNFIASVDVTEFMYKIVNLIVDKNSLYIVRDPDIVLMEYDLETLEFKGTREVYKSPNDKDSFVPYYIIKSSNSDYFLFVNREIVDYKFVITNKNFEVVYEQAYSHKDWLNNKKNGVIENILLTNKGDVLMFYDQSEKGVDLEYPVVHKFTRDKEVGQKFIGKDMYSKLAKEGYVPEHTEFFLTEDDVLFGASGYLYQGVGSPVGNFIFNLSVDEMEIGFSKKTDFGVDIFLEGKPDKEKNKIESNFTNGKHWKLDDFKVDELIVSTDVFFVLNREYKYVDELEKLGDLLVSKYSLEGEFLGIHKVMFDQVYSDFGDNLKVCYNESQLYVLTMDAKENIGERLPDQQPRSYKGNSRFSVLSCVIIDLDGNVSDHLSLYDFGEQKDVRVFSINDLVMIKEGMEYVIGVHYTDNNNLGLFKISLDDN